jgi:uncharacterized protein (DUF2147 family)
MVILRFGSLIIAALLVTTPVAAQGTAPAAGHAASAPYGAQFPTPVGIWLHDNKRIEIEIAPCGDLLCGKLVWFKWANDAQGLPLVDLKNVDPALRSRPLLGLTVLYGLRRTGDNSWEDGKIYNPDDGVDYDATMSIAEDGTLQIRAYVLLPLFGHTLVWTRMQHVSPVTPANAR